MTTDLEAAVQALATPDEFRAWLGSMPGHEYAGSAWTARYSPVARFLNARLGKPRTFHWNNTGVSFRVTNRGEGTAPRVNHAGANGGGVMLSSAHWVAAFMAAVNRGRRHDESILASEALAALDAEEH